MPLYNVEVRQVNTAAKISNPTLESGKNKEMNQAQAEAIQSKPQEEYSWVVSAFQHQGMACIRSRTIPSSCM